MVLGSLSSFHYHVAFVIRCKSEKRSLPPLLCDSFFFSPKNFRLTLIFFNLFEPHYMPFALFIGPAILFLIVASPLFTLAPRLAATVGLSLLPAVMLSRVFSPVRYYLRLTTFLLGLAANSAWGVIVSIALSLVGKSMNINWVVARSFRLSTAPLCGVTFKVEGKEHLEEARPAVLVGNHQTMIDILC